MSALLVILQGPQGCGKGIAAPYIAAAMRCSKTYDEIDTRTHRRIVTDVKRGERVLVCTHDTEACAIDTGRTPHIRFMVGSAEALCELLTALNHPVGADMLRRAATWGEVPA